ncbi:MAG: LamG-like jellyroll fold domain-containing protein [Pseudomonadota bacterium]
MGARRQREPGQLRPHHLEEDRVGRSGRLQPRVQPGPQLSDGARGGADYLRATAVDLDTNWHYLASAASGTSGRLYVDGSDRTSDGTLGTITASTQPLYIGKSPTGEYFSGAIDEARVSSVARTAAWLALQNTSMRDALFSYGVEEQPDTLAASTSVNLQPKTTKLTFETVPPGLSLTARSEAEVTPFEATEIVGSALTVVAPQTQVLGGVTYEFSSWSDGGLATHLVVANAAPAPLVAVYTPAATCSDGAKNGNETGVDCGGSCPPCLGCQPSGCDDANLCTTDACDPALSCTHAPVGCDDANACTTDGCSPATGCTHAPVVCNDSNVCTSDSCSSASGCVFATNTSPCPDDGNACTNDVCNAGACTHPDNGSCSSTAPFQESSGMVVLEAEHFHASVSRQNHSWNLTTNSGSSGGQALTVSPDNGLTVNTGYATTSPELRFQVAFVTTGTYQVWLRGIGPNGDGDSCHAGLDGTAPASADRISTFGTSFGWSKTSIDGPAATLNVTSAGVHTVNLWMREDGFVLDKIVLTTSTSFTPSGTGAAESPRQSSGGCTPADCSDNNPCTTDTCTSGVCQHGPATNGSACTDDSNACTNDTCNGGTCTHPNNTAACTDDGSACTYDVCSGGVCTHPSNGTCSASPCTAYCSSPTTFATNSYQSGNLGTQATCHQTTANLNGGVCGNFASGRTLAVNGKQMACSGGNWSALPAKVNGGYCITTTAGNPAWAYFATW